MDESAKSDQKIVEAADIALALWLFRDSVWGELTAPQRKAAIRWLTQVNTQSVLDNNWHLFVVIVDRVLSALGQPPPRSSARVHYERIKEFHIGGGWFKDGPTGHVDYYNAWGFHYFLYWIDRIDPSWDPEFIHAMQREFLKTYRYLIGPEGFPIMGRSVCYRMAAAAPLVIGQRSHPEVVSPGEARRALDCIWQYFIQRGAVKAGNVTQGYCGDDPRILDRYSGPASGLWSLRSLVAAFELPSEADFWTAAPEPLPAERGAFELRVEGADWIVTGNQDGRAIQIEIPANAGNVHSDLSPYTLHDQYMSLVEDAPLRPRNTEAKFLRQYYRSDEPFCGCS